MTKVRQMQSLQSENTSRLISDYIQMIETKLEQITVVMQIDSNLNLTLPSNALKQREQSEKISDLKAQKILGLKLKLPKPD